MFITHLLRLTSSFSVDIPRPNAAVLDPPSSMIQSGRFTLKEMAVASDCSIPAVVKVRDN